MRLPPLKSPERYAGSYVFDFGDHASVGYTASEVAILLDSGQFPGGEAYRIYRALPDGTLDLQQVRREALGCQDGLLFYRQQSGDARQDFDQLVQLAEREPPPCPVRVQLTESSDARPARATAVLYAAESSQKISGWLNDIRFEGGDFVEGGSAEVARYYGAGPVVLDQREWGNGRVTSRSVEEVLATTHLAVQR